MHILRAPAVLISGLATATIALGVCAPTVAAPVLVDHGYRAGEPLKVVEKIVIKSGPAQVAVNASGSRAYVTSVSVSKVYVIDTKRGRIVARPTVPLGSAPVAVGSDGKVYVGTPSADKVTVLSESGAVVATLSVKSPMAFAANPKTSAVYVASEYGGVVAIIDGTKNAVVGTLPSAGQYIGQVRDVAVNAAGTRLYAVDGDSLHVFDLASGAPALEVGMQGNAIGVEVNADGSVAYVADNVGNRVFAVSTANGQTLATITSPSFSGPSFLAASGPTNRLYVSNSGYYSITTIDMSTNAVVGVVKYGGGGGIAVNASGTRVVDAGAAMKTTVVYSPRK
jgi:DNA-binding beta-propeller fold protein YncE